MLRPSERTADATCSAAEAAARADESVFTRALDVVVEVIASYIGLGYPTLDELDPETRANTRMLCTALKKEMEELQASKLAGTPHNAERLRFLEERKDFVAMYASQDG